MKSTIIASLVLSSVLLAGMNSGPASFSDFDTDANGKVNQEEFEAAQQKRMSAKAESGKMMKNAQNAPAFSDIDLNGDGSFDAGEFAEHQMQQRAKNQANRGMGGQGMGQGQTK
ncbi:MAG: EF-hand domain-containing protein [Sulfurimonas sp.]|nr:EF-hand domain-containing protein [Sulfurimonas sp.]